MHGGVDCEKNVFESTLCEIRTVFDRHLGRREGERRDRPHVQILVPEIIININVCFLTLTGKSLMVPLYFTHIIKFLFITLACKPWIV